jgi:hypothetical protein
MMIAKVIWFAFKKTKVFLARTQFQAVLEKMLVALIGARRPGLFI